MGAPNSEILKEGAKQGALGAVFEFAQPIGKFAGDLAKNGTANLAEAFPGINPALYAGVREGATIAAIGGGTYTIERLSGTPPQQALQSAALNSLVHIIGMVGEKAFNKTYRATDAEGNVEYLTIKPNGKVTRISGDPGSDPNLIDLYLNSKTGRYEMPRETVDITRRTENRGNLLSGDAQPAPQLIIKPNTELTGRAAEIQNATITRIEANPQKFIDEYIQKNGNIIGSDRAKELFPEYDANRLENDSAVYPAASAVSQAVMKQLLKTLPKDALVQVTAGGPGSGKSSAIENGGADLVYDSVMGNKEGNRRVIDAIAASGHKGLLTFVYRPIENAVVGNMKRSLREGRLVSGNNISNGHFNALSAFMDDTAQYAKSKGFEVDIYRTVEGKPSVRMSLEDLKRIRYNSIEEVKQRAIRAFDEEFKREKYSESIRRQFKSHLQ